MTATDQTDTPTSPANKKGFKALWLNPRRKRFWAIIIVLLYTLLGFFVVPIVIKNSITGFISKDLEREAQIKEVKFNPYALSLEIDEFEMKGKDDVKLASFDQFFVNFQLSSLFRWAWTFAEIRLDNPYVYYERFDETDSRLSRMLADLKKNRPEQPEEPDDEKSTGTLRLLVEDLQLNGGIVNVSDNVPDTPVNITFGPIDIGIQSLNTLPDKYGEQTVSITLPDDGSLQWQGNLSLVPLDSQGELQLKNYNLGVGAAYLKTMVPLKSFDGTLSTKLQYHVQIDKDNLFKLDIDKLNVELDDVAITGLTPSKEFFKLKQLALQDGAVRYPEQSIQFATLRLLEPQVDIWNKADGSLSVMDLVPEPQAKTAQPKTKEPEATEPEATEPEATEAETKVAQAAPSKTATDSESKAWQFGLKKLILESGSLNFVDHTIEPAAQIGITDLLVNASNISTENGATIPLSVAANLNGGGKLSVDAMLDIFPEFSFSGKTKIQGIPLSLAQPYVQQFAHIKIEKGSLNSDLDISVAADKPLNLSGTLQVPDLEINDTNKNKRLLAWKNLDIKQLKLDLASNKLKLSLLQFEQLFARIVIYKDKSTNLSGLVIEQDKNTAKPQADAKSEKDDKSDSFDVVIGGVNVKKSGMYFADESLPLPFATNIENLHGTISTIAINSSEPAKIKLEGQVDEYGLARINGAMNLLDPLRSTDISVEFRNLLMSSLSPYTVEFVGRKIAEGKLNLNLQYNIDKSQLTAKNKVTISDLQLGKKVPSPSAASLPLGLAIALLKDSNGVIDLDLPIEGNIGDPQFKIGGIIWHTFTSLITKAVTAPFKLLGSLIGIKSDDFGESQFLAGRFDLAPPEREKIDQLKQALLKRPELSVEISGAFDPKIDRPALQYSALRSTLIAKLGDDTADLEDVDLLDERLFKPLELLFEERFPDSSLDAIRDANKKPPVDDPQGDPVLDQVAYAKDLRDRLLGTVEVTDAELTALAQARGQAIKTAFLTDGFDASRIEIVAPKSVKSKDSEWVKFKLGIAAG